MSLNFDKSTFEVMTGYGEDPQDLREYKMSAFYNAYKKLKVKDQRKVLKWLGVSTKLWDKLTNAPSPKSLVSALVNANKDGFAAIFPALYALNSMAVSQIRMMENMKMWDDVQRSFYSMIGTDVLNDVVIIYTNENLFQKTSVNPNEGEILNSRLPTEPYKYAYYGTQYGEKIYIYGSYKIQD